MDVESYGGIKASVRTAEQLRDHMSDLELALVALVKRRQSTFIASAHRAALKTFAPTPATPVKSSPPTRTHLESKMGRAWSSTRIIGAHGQSHGPAA